MNRNAQAQTDTSSAPTGAVLGADAGLSSGRRTGAGTGAQTGVQAAGGPPVAYDIDGDGQIADAEREAIFRTWMYQKIFGSEPGPELLHLYDDDFKGTPQGQGYDEGRDELLTTYSGVPWTQEEAAAALQEWMQNGGPLSGGELEEPDRAVRLSIQDRTTGYENAYVQLGGVGSGEAPDKGGGVTTDGEYVWVADTTEIYRYIRSDIDAAEPGETVEAVDVQSTGELHTQNASYITYDDGHLYIGEFDKDTALPGDSNEGVPMIYRREVDDEGQIVPAEGGGQRTPNNAQGVAVTPRGLLFSASYGGAPGSPDDLIFQPWTDKESFDLASPDEARKVLDTDDYNQELNIIGDTVYVTHEGGSEQYDGQDGDQRIRKYPLEDLDEY